MLVGQGQFISVFRNEDDAEEMLCMWGYNPISEVTDVSVDVAHAAYDAFAANLLPFMTNQYNLVACRQQLAVPGGTVEAVWTENQEGAVDQDAVPQNTAFLVHKFTSGVGAGKKGRCYIPGVREDNVSSAGRLEGDYDDAITIHLIDLLEAFDDVTLPPMVVNRGLRVDPTDPPPRVPRVEPDPLWWDVTALGCDPYVATQRGRMRR